MGNGLDRALKLFGPSQVFAASKAWTSVLGLEILHDDLTPRQFTWSNPAAIWRCVNFTASSIHAEFPENPNYTLAIIKALRDATSWDNPNSIWSDPAVALVTLWRATYLAKGEEEDMKKAIESAANEILESENTNASK